MLTPKYQGIAIDKRSEYEKSLDYKHEDLASGDVPLNWIEHDKKVIKEFEIQNQDGSSSCVAQGTSKILAMHEVKEGRSYSRLCPHFIYTRRENYPDGGMWLPNALSIACNSGSCLEKLLPCDNQPESFMNDRSKETDLARKNAIEYKAKLYFEIKSRSIDAIAQVLESGYGVLLGVRFDYNEWVDVPFIDQNSKLSCGHGIAAVDYVLYNGEKALIIEDSWGPGYGKGGRRIITETFLKSRCFYAGYITSLPNYIFTKTLKFGMKNSVDVRMLQNKLNSLGFILNVDGNFGKFTQLAVIAVQKKYGLKSDGIVGPNTNKVINTI